MARETARDDELSGRPAIRKRALEICEDWEKAADSSRDRSDKAMDYWEAYNCVLGANQYYSGKSQIFVPLISTAIDARKTRFVNQIFPVSSRQVECITENGDIPHAEVALLEHYIRKARLRTEVAPALNVAGDLEGQYSVYVHWKTRSRRVAWREMAPIKVGGIDVPEAGEVEDVVEETMTDDHPWVEVLADPDVEIWPQTADSVDDALATGGGVAVMRRWSKAKVHQMTASGEIDKEAGRKLELDMSNAAKKEGKPDMPKTMSSAAGIRFKGKFAIVIEIWSMLKVDGEMRLCRCYYAGDHQILGVKLCPYWCDLCPVISVPVAKVHGQLKGVPPVQRVIQLQYYANDMANEGADSSTYSMMPIIATDPAKNPRVDTMIVDLAAVWQADPNSTRFMEFPKLWQDAFQIIAACEQKVFQSLGVNPAMVPQSSGGRGGKRNQAEIANEQQVDILTTADAVTVQEEGIWTPILERFMAYDAQFRSSVLMVRQFGAMGRRVEMETVPPIQWGKRYEFRWLGVESARNAAQVQQQIAGINVLRGIPPEMYPGRKLDLTPIVEHLVMNTFGARLAPLIFIDQAKQLSIEPEEENGMLAAGFDLAVMPLDDDPRHMQVHMQALVGGDPHGTIRSHLMKHQHQMMMKSQAQQSPQGGQPGTPGGAGPGVPGQPPPGAMPGQPRPNGPPGMIHPDQMPRAGAVSMPRKM